MHIQFLLFEILQKDFPKYEYNIKYIKNEDNDGSDRPNPGSDPIKIQSNFFRMSYKGRMIGSVRNPFFSEHQKNPNAEVIKPFISSSGLTFLLVHLKATPSFTSSHNGSAVMARLGIQLLKYTASSQMLLSSPLLSRRVPCGPCRKL